MTHALKVDFWDIDQMANKMIAVLKYAPLGETLRFYGRNEVRERSWEDAGAAVEHIYSQVLTTEKSAPWIGATDGNGH